MNDMISGTVDTVAHRAVSRYPHISGATIRLLNHSENWTYLVEDSMTPARYILRVSRPGYHTREELHAELQWMDAIKRDTSLALPEPIAGFDGDAVQSIAEDAGPGTYYCTLFTFLNGVAPDESNATTMASYFRKLGEITAQLHRHAQTWPQATSLRRPTWDLDTLLGENPLWGRWDEGPDLTPVRRVLFQQVADILVKRLAAFGKGPERFGLIHADLRLSNLLIDTDQVKVLDFDDSGYGWYLYDLAAALSFIEDKSYVPSLIHSWLKGYEHVRPLSSEEKQEIPTFIMLRRLALLAWLGTHAQSDTAHVMTPLFAARTETLARHYLLRFA